MLAKTVFSIDVGSSVIKDHLGIPHDHPALIHARDDFHDKLQHSVVLIVDQGCLGDPQVISLVDTKHPNFIESPDHTEVVGRLNRLAGYKLVDRELFLHALYQLYLRYDPPLRTGLGLPPVGKFQTACFQLLCDYAPGTYCIAATAALAPNGRSVDIRYSKYSYPD